MGRKYFDTGKSTSDWDALENGVRILRDAVMQLMKIDDLDKLTDEEMQQISENAWCPEMLTDSNAHVSARQALKTTEPLVATDTVSHRTNDET